MTTQDRSTLRGFAAFGGLSSLAATVPALAATVLASTADTPQEDGILPVVEETADHVDELVAASWLYLMNGVGLLLFAAFLAVRWRGASGWLLPAAMTMLAATAVVFFDNLLAIGVYDVLVPAMAGQGTSVSADLVAVGDALDVVILSGHLLFQGLLGLAAVMGGLALLSGVPAPRWLGYLGLVAGAALVAYAATRWGPLVLAGSLLFGAWTLAVGGWSLWSRRTGPVTASAHD